MMTEKELGYWQLVTLLDRGWTPLFGSSHLDNLPLFRKFGPWATLLPKGRVLQL